MENSWIITVGREFCSGGAEIAHKVASALEIPYFDRNIIDHTAEILKLSTDIVREHDEKPVRFWNVSGYQYNNLLYSEDPSLLLPLSYRVADAQFKLIREAAEKGPCVVVGRAAGYALRDRENVLRVFIYADLEKRIARAMRLYQISAAEAKKLIVRTDKIRRSYYENYTQQKWDGPESYDLMFNSGELGIEAVAETIVHFAQSMPVEKKPL